MPFFPITREDMVAKGLQRLRDHSNVTQLSPGSKTRLLIDFTTDEQYGEHRLFDENMAQAFIRWSDGRFLDFFGDMLNIPRLQPETAEVEVEEQNFIFYIDGGNFGDINNDIDFVIPAGVNISTPTFPTERPTYAQADYRPRQERIEYDLVEDVLCRANQSFAFGRIRAKVEGRISDVPRSVLTEHGFTGYVLATQERLKCTNKYAVSSGRNRESDEAYRYRLMNAFKARERANRMAIRLAALSIPGVRDIFEFNAEQGPGTFSIYVDSLTPTTSPKMLNLVREVVDRVCAYGVRPFVLAAMPLGLEFVIAVNWKSTSTLADQAKGYADIRHVVESHLDSVRLGLSVSIEDLATLVATTNKNIQAIGLERAGTFEEVYIYRQNPSDNSVRKVLFTGDEIIPLYNEQIILETNTKYRGIRFL